MARVLPILLVLWAVASVGWVFLGEDGPVTDPPPGEKPKPAPTPAGGVPGLAPAPAQAAPPAAREEEVPATILAAARALHRPDERAWFFAWLDARPARILLLLRDEAQRLGRDARGDRLVWAFARNLFATYGARLRAALPHVVEALATERDALRLCALLGALDGGLPADAPLPPRVPELVADARQLVEVRVFAALLALARRADAATVDASLDALVAERGVSFLGAARVLRMLADRGPEGRAHLEALLRLHERTRGHPWFEGPALEALLALAPEDARVRERLQVSARSRSPHVRATALRVLFQGPVEDVLAFLETAPAATRLAGVEALLARGVDKTFLAGHLMAGLRSGRFETRERAVRLLGKVGRDVDEVLPVLEAHLASGDHGRWLSAVHALGALATVPGEKDDVVQRLLEVGRRPDVRVRKAAVQAVLMHDARPGPVIGLLDYLLDDADAGVRAEAVDALGELSAEHAAARRALERVRTDPSPEVRELVVYWLDEEEDEDR